MLPTILHIPHSSKVIPPELAKQFIISKTQLRNELNLLTDHYTDELLAPMQISADRQVVSPVSRLIVDVERFADDQQEKMSQVGMGAIYTHGSQKQQIRRQLSESEKAYLFEQFYEPHHAALNEATNRSIGKYNQAIIIDVHSYPSKPLPYERSHQQLRPQICIGTCDYHTPKILIDSIKIELKGEGFNVELNTPFAGTLIPIECWQKNKNVIGFMLEIRRDIYMNEVTFNRLQNFQQISHRISNAIMRAINKFSEALHND